ncbi:MAG: EamA family transporter RarD [Candidatus Sedimenticola sp. (ex Thyasira tokunagai)]
MNESESIKKGLIYATLAFGLWGFGPIYFKAVASVQPMEVLAHRIIWSLFFLALIISWNRGWPSLFRLLAERKKLLWLFTTSVIVSCNWLVFIWAVANDRILEASLGYFINPLFSVLLAMLVLGERLRFLQGVAIAIAVVGVTNQILIFGELPLVALVLAVTFGFYGLLRKIIAVDPVHGLTVETLLMLPFALIYLFWLDGTGGMSFIHAGTTINLLLIAAGLVTAVPLIYFAAATNRLSLTVIGLFQYLAPSMTFLLAVFLYHEPFGGAQMVTFSTIWFALALFSLEGWRYQRRKRSLDVVLQNS